MSSAYLARLKQLEKEKISSYTPETVLTKPPKAPFVSFGGTGRVHIEKKIIDAAPFDVELFEERAAILEFDAGFPRQEAERLAKEEVIKWQTLSVWPTLQ